MADVETEIEIRQVYEGADFGESFTPEIRDRHEKMDARIAEQHG